MCGKCRTAKYCSRTCQLDHWPLHKRQCKILAITAPAVPAPVVKRPADTYNEPDEEGVTSDEPTGVMIQVGDMTMVSNTLTADMLKTASTIFQTGGVVDLNAEMPVQTTEQLARNVRLHSASSSGHPIVFESLLALAREMQGDSSFVDAAKCYTLALDVLHTRAGAGSTYGRTKAEREQLLTLHYARAECYLSAAAEHRSLAMVEDACDDIDVALESGAFAPADNQTTIGQNLLEKFARVLLPQAQALQLQLTPQPARSAQPAPPAAAPSSESVAAVTPPSPPPAAAPEASTRRLTRRQLGRLEQQRTLVRREPTTPTSAAADSRSSHQRKPVSAASEEEDMMAAVSVMNSAALVESQSAFNAQCLSDSCPVCRCTWESLDNLGALQTLVTVLPCAHAICLPCLSEFRRSADVSFRQETQRGELRTKFCCTLCTFELPLETVQVLADHIVQLNLVPSLTELASRLSLRKAERSELLATLLQQNDFDFQRVESALVNMVGLFIRSNERKALSLSWEEKQQIFETARAPQKHLQAEFDELKGQLDGMFNTKSTAYREVRSRLATVSAQLSAAKQNATRDIFERMNNSSTIDSEFVSSSSDSGRGESLMRVDLHGLHIEEAKAMLSEHVLPVLPVFKSILVITGKGLHSKKGQQFVLRDAMKKFLLTVNTVNVEVQSGNEGALLVSLR